MRRSRVRKVSPLSIGVLRAGCIVAVLLAACAIPKAGREFDTTHVGDLRKVEQDKDQVRRWFGPPLESKPLTDDYFGCVER